MAVEENQMTTVVVIGNTVAEHATEAAWRDGFRAAGCTVVGVAQDECYERGPVWFLEQCKEWQPSLVTYSRTHSDSALKPAWTPVWEKLEADDVRTVGLHLDLFWGLAEREVWIKNGDPMFRMGLLMTADGGSQDAWESVGVRHQWLPAGCDSRYVFDAPPIPELKDQIVWVGSWRNYHPAYPGRHELISFARSKWPNHFVEYGGGSMNGAVRGGDLARIYASDCIVLGDSCFAGQRANYWSDRLPETLGRGGFLLHPYVPGIRSMYSGEVLATYEAGNFDDLDAQIGYFLANPGLREGNKERGRDLVLRRDTYRHRAVEVLEAVGLGARDE